MKKFWAMLLAGAMVFSLAACGGGTDDTTADTTTDTTDTADTADTGDTAAAGDISVDVILKTTASEYWGYVQAGAEAYGEENGVSVTVKGATSETAYDEQLNMIETDLANEEYDAFVIAPLQADMVIQQIAGQTKPIIAVDTDIDAPEVLSFVGTGNEEAGKMGGEAAVALAKERGWEEINCIEICGVQGDATNEARKAGYKAGVEAAGGTFLDDETQYANAVADQAVACMEAIMQNHPEGVAIICANNDDMAMAAARAAAGNEAYANTVFMGFDGIQSACNAILNGELTMSVAQEAYQMGYLAVEAAVNAVNGEMPEDFIDSGCSIVDANNAQERLDTLKGYLA